MDNMSADKMSLKGKGLVWELVLQGGGIKNFLLFDGIVGIICLFFSLVTGSLLPFGLFSLITVAILAFLFKLASSPKDRIFFLDSNTYYRVIKMQMSLMGDSSGIKQIGPKTEFVQPVIDTKGDIVTEAKADYKKTIGDKS